MEAQEVPSEVQPTLAGEVMDSLGEPQEAADQINDSNASSGAANPALHDNDPLYVQKRLKQQRRQHEREIRELQAKMANMQNQMGQNQMGQNQNQSTFPTPMDAGSLQGQSGSVGDQIQQAVQMALNHREMQERKQKEAESAAHVQKQYGELHRHLDSMGDKYDDFDDLVRSDDVPITPAMRDYALTLPRKGNGSAGEVLYHLAKNKDELNRISKLHPVDQASEMARLSQALISGGENKVSQSRPTTMGQIKTAPVTNNQAVTDKTPVGNIRKRMMAGTWK